MVPSLDTKVRKADLPIQLHWMQMQAHVSSGSTLTQPQSPADSAISERGLDDFDAWDEDTQKQWKRFMKGSRSQEVCHSCLWPSSKSTGWG